MQSIIKRAQSWISQASKRAVKRGKPDTSSHTIRGTTALRKGNMALDYQRGANTALTVTTALSWSKHSCSDLANDHDRYSSSKPVFIADLKRLDNVEVRDQRTNRPEPLQKVVQHDQHAVVVWIGSLPQLRGATQYNKSAQLKRQANTS